MTSLIACQPPPKDCSHTVLKKERENEGETEGASVGGCRAMSPLFPASPPHPPPLTPHPFHHAAISPLAPSIYLPPWSSDAVANSLCALLPQTQTGQGLCTGDASHPQFLVWYKQIVRQIVQKTRMKVGICVSFLMIKCGWVSRVCGLDMSSNVAPVLSFTIQR